nr:uncharacterized protein LOC117273885 [Nicotiana tomentosiformis]
MRIKRVEERPIREVHSGRRLSYGSSSRAAEDLSGTDRETSHRVETSQPSSTPVHLGVPTEHCVATQRPHCAILACRRRMILFRSPLRPWLLMAQRPLLLSLLALLTIMLLRILR